MILDMNPDPSDDQPPKVDAIPELPTADARPEPIVQEHVKHGDVRHRRTDISNPEKPVNKDWLQRRMERHPKWLARKIKQYIAQAKTLHTTESEAMAISELYKNSKDPVTGVANRRFFDEEFGVLIRRYSREVPKDKQIPCSLVMLDINKFKLYNDTMGMGHARGDKALKKIARTVDSFIAETYSASNITALPLVARFGGEEFALLLPGIDTAQATNLMNAINAKLMSEEIRFRRDDEEKTVEMTVNNASFAYGVVELEWPERRERDSLIKRADAEMYAMKNKIKAGEFEVDGVKIPYLPVFKKYEKGEHPMDAAKIKIDSHASKINPPENSKQSPPDGMPR